MSTTRHFSKYRRGTKLSYRNVPEVSARIKLNQLERFQVELENQSSFRNRKLDEGIIEKTKSMGYLVEVFGKKHKQDDIYTKVVDELGVPRPTVRRVARDLRLSLHEKINRIQTMYSQKQLAELLSHVEKNDFNAILQNMRDIKGKELDIIVGFCDNLENVFNIERLTMEPSLQKIKIENYQRNLFEIKKIANQLKKDPDNQEMQKELTKYLKDLERKLESRAALSGIMNEYGYTEKQLEKEMAESQI